MPIQRSGPTPPFYDYVTSKALVPAQSPPNPELLQLITGQFEWIEIPRFQRGISWELDNVIEFLESHSVLLGNVILGQFTRPSHMFPYLPNNVNVYSVLVDGLQRFAVGTMLLAILDPLVFGPTAQRKADSVYFAGLAARVSSLSPIYMHNDLEFRNHQRQAIKTQYARLREDVEQYVLKRLNNGEASELAQVISNTFLNRQIALDTYFNFDSTVALMSTFLGINTLRVDLGPVDLLRALIVEKATASGWSAEEIDDIENEFTSTFTVDEKPDGELLPFANVVLNTVQSGYGSRVFPSWNSTLDRDEVQDFLDFVQDFRTNRSNGYFRELCECGAIPLAIVMSYYYVQCVHHDQPKPSFLNGGNDEDGELHRLLIAAYRALLAGSIGRSRSFAEEIMNGSRNHTLPELADQLSKAAVGITVLDEVDWNWLTTVLNKADKNKSKRIFNAMLLPPKSNGFGTVPFSPLIFGRRSKEFHVDHLIPKGQLQSNAPGYEEGERLRNFAPLPSNQNRVAKDTSCSAKLAPGNIYDTYISNTTVPVHPYCEWLVRTHGPSVSASDLDRQELLERNRTPDLGDRRIQFIADTLKERI